MTGKNEVHPLSPAPPADPEPPANGPSPATTAAGPAMSSIPVPTRPAKATRNQAANLVALSSQERRLRLVAQQRRYSSFQLFYGLFGVVLMIVQMQYLYFANTQGFTLPCATDPTTQCPLCRASLTAAVPVTNGRMILHAVRVLISISTVILLYYVYTFYAAECEVLKIKNVVPPKASLLSSPVRNAMLLESLCLAVHPFPGLETVDPEWPNLAVALSLFMLPRVLLALRVVRVHNSFNSSNGWFIGSLTNVDFTTTFFLKATLKNYPTQCLVVSFSLLLALTSYSLFVVERFLCTFVADSCCSPLAFTDVVWFVVTTILTIGYGDVVATTGSGRLLATGAGLLGTILMAVTIAVMSTYLSLTRSEHKVNAFLRKDENRRLVNDHAARAIQAYIALRALKRRGLGTGSSNGTGSGGGVQATATAVALCKAEAKFFSVLRVYRRIKRFVNSHDVSDPMDRQMTMLEMMEVNVEYIRTKIEDLSELFHSQVDKTKSRKRLSLTNGSVNRVSAPAATTAPVEASDSIAATARMTAFTRTVMASSPTPTTSLSVLTTTASPTEPTVATPASLTSATECEQASHVGSSDCIHTTQSHHGLASGVGVSLSSRPLGGDPVAVVGPDWAMDMRNTLQLIIVNVARVSSEVDELRTRVESQMDQLQARLTVMERRAGLQSAFSEVTRAPSFRRSFSSRKPLAVEYENDGVDRPKSTGASPMTPGQDAGGSGVGNGNGNGYGYGNRSASPAATEPVPLQRVHRLSFRTPSIRNFITVNEADDVDNMKAASPDDGE